MKLAKLVVLLGLVACNGGGGKQNRLPDAGKLVDAAPLPVQCLLAPTMGDVIPTEQFAYSAMPMDATSPTNFYLLADLNQEMLPDYVMVDLYKNYGAFKANGWPTAPMEIQITGEETDYSTCGACVLVYTDLSEDGEPTGDPYIATAGTMKLQAVGPQRMAGRLENIQLTHVVIDEETFASTPHEDGCKATLGSIDFDAIPAPPEAFAPAKWQITRRSVR